jgi:hypothetical protein
MAHFSSPSLQTRRGGQPTRLPAIFTALAACVALSAPASATLITNGSFESGTAGWTVGGGGVDVVSAPAWGPQDGNNLVDLNAFAPGSLSQVIPTVVGQSYLLEFALSGNFSTTSFTKTVNVAAGPTFASYSFAMPVGWTTTNMFWTTIEHFFIANAPTSTISFTSTVPGAEGVALDAITVTVPEPGVLALLGLGLAGIGFSRRRRLR